MLKSNTENRSLLRRLFGKYLGVETAAVPVWPPRGPSLAAARPLTLARIDPGTPLSLCNIDIHV